MHQNTSNTFMKYFVFGKKQPVYGLTLNGTLVFQKDVLLVHLWIDMANFPNQSIFIICISDKKNINHTFVRTF